jgi:transcriptional regulator with XRE-family HTH domain
MIANHTRIATKPTANPALAIRARRAALDISQERFAEYAECHHNYVGLVERGEQNLTIDGLLRFARALKCCPSDLLRDAGL